MIERSFLSILLTSSAHLDQAEPSGVVLIVSSQRIELPPYGQGVTLRFSGGRTSTGSGIPTALLMMHADQRG